MRTIDLSGQWRVHTQDNSITAAIILPGSSCEAGIGRKSEYYSEYCREAVRAPQEKYEYIGELIYEREIDIPEEFDDMSVSFFFERINILSKLYFDGVQIGREITSLSAPHVYELSDRLIGTVPKISGHHTITLAIDNADHCHIGEMASGYSVDTQGYWNGCIGRMELIGRPLFHVASVSVFPRNGRLDIETVTEAKLHTCCRYIPARLSYEIADSRGTVISSFAQDIELFSKRQRSHMSIERPEKLKLWNEFEPELYTIRVSAEFDGSADIEKNIVPADYPGTGYVSAGEVYETQFAVRTLAADDRQFFVNERPTSLRGTINCAQYPLTGYPPMDEGTWEQHFNMYRRYGLNHVRFHAWCPPEAAFRAADRLGIYLAVEMPLWLNREVTVYEFGDDARHEELFRNEGIRILRTYGDHPSFLCFSNGNENMGDFSVLEDYTRMLKSLDDRHFYTMTSNFDHPKSPFEDYRVAFEIEHRKVRNQNIQDEVAASTCTDFEDVCGHAKAPVISFEVGQYAVYPDIRLCEKYTGNMLPVNLRMISDLLQRDGDPKMLERYLEASGDIAMKLYKEDIEAFLRTDRMGGIQLLSLVDYTGQSTATVGALNIFHEEKPGMPSAEWTDFCGEVVPLFMAKRIYTNDETIEADLKLYDHGRTPIIDPVYHVSVMCHDRCVYKTEVKGSSPHISVPLKDIEGNAFLKVYVKVFGNGREYTNSWRIFVFDSCADSTSAGAVKTSEESGYIADTPEALEKAVSEGRSVIACRGAFEEKDLAKNSFIPVFWSPVHFATKAPCGAMIDEKHAALKDFPTEKFPDYQWKDLIDGSVTMDITDMEGAEPIVEMVPNFVDNRRRSPLCILDKKGVKVLFCGFDIASEEITARALRKSLLEYIKR